MDTHLKYKIFDCTYQRNLDTQTLVFLHGGSYDHGRYINIGNILAQHYNVVLLSIPGFGGSPKEQGPYTLASIRDTLLIFLEQLEIANIVLAGHSLGAGLAFDLAHHLTVSQAKIKVEKLVLITPQLAPLDLSLLQVASLSVYQDYIKERGAGKSIIPLWRNFRNSLQILQFAQQFDLDLPNLNFPQLFPPTLAFIAKNDLLINPSFIRLYSRSRDL
ncbi:alpha/beta fold hydrolase [bacterium]|nr:MAG: alpha/beta fold hydrolase [bacterium]